MSKMTKLATAVMLSLGAMASVQATTLAAGDLSFTGLARESGYGGWSFVSWVDIAAGTSIDFSDRGIAADGSYKAGVTKENNWTWTATSAVTKGTQVVVYGGAFDTALGSISGGSSGMGAKNVTTGSLAYSGTDGIAYVFDSSSSGETFTAKQGGSFIAAISNYTTPALAALSDAPLNTGLGANIQNINYAAANGGTGDGAIQRTEWYKGATTGLDAAGYKALIGDQANWSSDTGTSVFKSLALLEGAGQTAVAAGAAVGVGAGNFTVITAAVPEPETYAMLLAGLGLLGLVARRRNRV